MFETLFGAEMPLTVRFFLAFLIVLGLIGAGRMGSPAVRQRPVWQYGTSAAVSRGSP